nr:hypothetical protein [Tanacetum cinerariifolium]
MDSIISLRQKNTLAEYMILSDTDNRPPMLDKDLQKNTLAEYMILSDTDNRPPMLDKDLTNKYAKLSAAKKIQANCDRKATNIILQGLPADIYSLVNHHRLAKDLLERVQLLMQGEDLIACLNKAMSFLTTLASSRFPSTNNQLRTSSNLINQATIQDRRVTMQQVQGRQGQNYSGTMYKGNATSSRGNTTSGQARVVKCYNRQEEESRSKMSKKAKDPEVIAKKISHKPIDYEKLNRLTDDFGKRFTPQQELLTEQAFWLRISNPFIESSLSPIRVEVPSELPKNNLKAQLKDKDTTICKLKDTIKSLRKNKKEEIVDHDRCELATINVELENRKATIDNVAQIPSATTVAPGMFKLDLDPLAHKLVHNRESRCYYLKHTQKQADTCPSAVKLSETKVARTPMDKIKKVTFAEPIASSSTIQETDDSNKPMLYSLGVKCSTSPSRLKPSRNIKNNRISQPSSSNKINKVEDQPRSVKTRKNNKNRVKQVKCDDHVMQSMSNANSVSVSINNAHVKNFVNDVKSDC